MTFNGKTALNFKYEENLFKGLLFIGFIRFYLCFDSFSRKQIRFESKIDFIVKNSQTLRTIAGDNRLQIFASYSTTITNTLGSVLNRMQWLCKRTANRRAHTGSDPSSATALLLSESS